MVLNYQKKEKYHGSTQEENIQITQKHEKVTRLSDNTVGIDLPRMQSPETAASCLPDLRNLQG